MILFWLECVCVHVFFPPSLGCYATSSHHSSHLLFHNLNPPPKKNKKTKKKRNICWMCYIIRLSTRKNTFNSFTTDVTFLFVDKSWNKVIFKFMIFVVSWLEKICSGHFLFTIKQEIVCFLFFFLKKFSQHNIK